MSDVRVFVSLGEHQAEAVLRDGWTDLHHDADLGLVGVWCEHRPGEFGRGPQGDVTLCQHVPQELFDEFQMHLSTVPEPPGLTPEQLRAFYASAEHVGVGYAIIPAARLNAAGRPRLFAHAHATGSRRDVLAAAARWEEAGQRQAADNFRRAVAFLDRVGWCELMRDDAEEGQGDA
jgi:hypothetical protein